MKTKKKLLQGDEESKGEEPGDEEAEEIKKKRKNK